MEVGRWRQWDSHWGSWRWASAACGEGSCGGRPGDLARTSMVLSPSHVLCCHWPGSRARKTPPAHCPLNSILLHTEYHGRWACQDETKRPKCPQFEASDCQDVWLRQHAQAHADDSFISTSAHRCQRSLRPYTSSAWLQLLE